MEQTPVMLLEAEYLQKVAEVLKAVAHPLRLQIAHLLEAGERTGSDLCQLLGSPQPYISQQLNLMKAKGVLESRRDGNQVFYAIADPGVVKVIHCVRQQAGWLQQ